MKFLGVIVIIALILAGAYLLAPDAFEGLWGASGTSTTTPQTSVRAYESATYGLAFEYPDSYTLRETDTEFEGTDIHIITIADTEALAEAPQNGEGPPSINVSITTTNATSTENWIRTSPASNFALATDEGLRERSVAGETALEYRSDGLYATKNVIVLKDGTVYHFSVGWIAESDPIVDDFEQLISSVELD